MWCALSVLSKDKPSLTRSGDIAAVFLEGELQKGGFFIIEFFRVYVSFPAGYEVTSGDKNH
jgi:hypothetical protein